MEWHRAKTILIILFLCVNIFLLSILVNSNNKSGFDKEGLNNLLAKNNITVDQSNLPHPDTRIFVPEFYGVNDEIIRFFIPKIQKVDGTTYSNAGKTLIVEGNKISYTDASPTDISFRNINTRNIKSKLKPALTALGVYKHAVLENVSASDGMYLAEFSYRIDKHEIFYSRLTFLISSRGIMKCEGAIYSTNKKSGYSYEINTSETILVQFSQNYKDSPTNITSVRLGLYILDYENALTTQAIPAYEISTDNKTYIYDARIGVDIKDREVGESLR